MKTVLARVPMGRTAKIEKVQIFTKEEARKILNGKEWEVDIDIYDVEVTNKRIGWLAAFPNGEGIFVEA